MIRLRILRALRCVDEVALIEAEITNKSFLTC